jgi:succinoglycan biosynthesis transport protein ExoP
MELFISFSEIIHFFKRTWVRFLAVVIIFSVACSLLSMKLFHRSYSANSTITLSCDVPEDAGTEYRLQYSGILTTRVQTAVAQANSRSIITNTAEKLGIDSSEIISITGEQVLSAPVVKITVQTKNAERTAEISDTAAQVLADDITQQFPSPKLTVALTDMALPATVSSSKSAMMKSGFLGAILGFLLYVMYGLICVLSDRTVRNSRFAEEALKISLLGEIPHSDNQETRDDAFRRLRAAVLHKLNNAASILVESVSDGDEGAETAMGLASSLAHAGKRVILVDGDLHNPKIAGVFKVHPKKTFNDVLSRACGLTEAVADVAEIPGLSIVCGARTEESPADLFAKGFGSFTVEAKKLCDYLIVYAPASTRYPDAENIAAASEAVILNVKYGSTSYLALRDALHRTTEVGGKVAGFVVAGV